MPKSDTSESGTWLSDDGSALEGFYRGLNIFRYVYRPDTPAVESPKPYFHPLRSLSGATLTGFRPEDHPWHHGLSMTLTLVDDHNFWGGPTYRREDGYLDRSNQGRQNHVGWLLKTHDRYGIRLKQALDWQTGAGDTLLSEQRLIEFDFSQSDSDGYVLSFDIDLQNVSGKSLSLDTYASASGLAGSPYTGLQFRGCRGFMRPKKELEYRLFADGRYLEVPDVHGRRWPWIAACGTCTADHEATLIFCDDPGNPRYPNVFFIREDSDQVAFSFVGDQTLKLQAGESIRLRYRLAIVSRSLSEAEIYERAGLLLATSD